LCYEKHAAMHTGLNSLLAASAGNWLVPPLKVVCRNTYQLAVQADAHKSNPLASSASSSVHLENAVTVVQESFSRTFNDRKELGNDMYSFSADGGGSKKSAVLYIVNLLFAAYFRLNTLRLCKNLVRPMESRNIPEQTQSYPLGQIIMYRYYVGRLYLFEDSYDQAEMQLQYCLSKCAVLDQQLRQRDTSGPSRILENNTRRILRYLIPVKIFRGKLPTLQSKWITKCPRRALNPFLLISVSILSAVLNKYGLFEFVPIVTALRQGNLRQFNTALIDFQDRFIRYVNENASLKPQFVAGHARSISYFEGSFDYMLF
jgi:hypothetical protein